MFLKLSCAYCKNTVKTDFTDDFADIPVHFAVNSKTFTIQSQYSDTILFLHYNIAFKSIYPIDIHLFEFNIYFISYQLKTKIIKYLSIYLQVNK